MYCRYLTHLKWAEGSVEKEDALLPYPKKVTTLATVSQPTSSPPSLTDIAETVAADAVPKSVVLHEQAKVPDAWASYDAEESEYFWRSSSARSSRAVNDQTVESAGRVESQPVTSTAAHNTSDMEVSGHSSSGTSCAERTRSDVFGNTTGAASDADKNYTLSKQSAVAMDKPEAVKYEEENSGSTSTTNTSDNGNRDLSCSVVDAVSAAVSCEMEVAECQMEEPSLNIDESVQGCTNSSAGGADCGADISAPAERICHEHTEHDSACSVSDSHIGSSSLPEDDINVSASCESDRDISLDCRCANDDSNADAYVLDDTDDSDVDENFVASQPCWRTARKRDPYPMKERLLLSLEEVIFDRN